MSRFVMAATFTRLVFLSGPQVPTDSFKEAVSARVFSAVSNQKSNSLRGFPKGAGWFPGQGSWSNDTTKNLGSFHCSADLPCVCQSPGWLPLQLQTELQALQASFECGKFQREKGLHLHEAKVRGTPLTSPSDTSAAGHVHGQTRLSTPAKGGLLWSTGLIIKVDPFTSQVLLGALGVWMLGSQPKVPVPEERMEGPGIYKCQQLPPKLRKPLHVSAKNPNHTVTFRQVCVAVLLEIWLLPQTPKSPSTTILIIDCHKRGQLKEIS